MRFSARWMSASGAVALLLVFGGCGGDDEPAQTEPSRDGADASLRVSVSGLPDDGTDSLTIVCPPDVGESEGVDAERACRNLDRIESLLTADTSGRVCTQIYGGPQKARVRGTIGGEEINRRLSRHNGCRIAEWDRFFELIGKRYEVGGPPRPAD